jgi:hypothetical protein
MPKGTMMRMGRVGQACADAGRPAKSAAPKTKPVLREIMTHPRFI